MDELSVPLHHQGLLPTSPEGPLEAAVYIYIAREGQPLTHTHTHTHTCLSREEVTGERGHGIRSGLCESTPPGWQESSVCNAHNNM